MFGFIKKFMLNLLDTRMYWFCVAAISAIFEYCGYYFQYVEDLKPCELCVYERCAFACILIIGLFVMIKPNVLKWIGIPAWIYAAYMGLSVAIEHVAAENNIFATCNQTIGAGRFWIPLDQYIPEFFNPTGACGDIPWKLFDLSMPWWVRAIFIGYLSAIAVSVLWHLAMTHWRRRAVREGWFS